MALMPPSVVPAPEPRGLRYGLFTASNGPLELAGHSLGAGFQYEPVSCGRAYRYPIECDDTPPEKTFDEPDDFVVADPFLVYGSVECRPVGRTPEALEAIARRRLANGEQTEAEAELAELLAANDIAVGSADMTSLTAVVAELEQWLYGTMRYGNVGVLHAPARVAAYAMNEGGLVTARAAPGLLTTALGTVWSFGGGYPDGTIYITGQTTVWRAADVMVHRAFDHTGNMWTVLAEREYAVGYDCHVASAPFDFELVS